MKVKTSELPEPHAKVDGKLGTYCSFESTEARRGDAVYTADQMRDYARAALAATPAPAEPVAWLRDFWGPDGGPVAWMIRSRTGLIRCCLTEEPDDERRALAEIDGDTIAPLFAAPVAATPAPAPRRQLTDEQIKARKPICADFVSFRAGIRSIELDFGITK